MHFFDILMQVNHLIMQLFNPDILLKTYWIVSKANAVLFLGRHFPMRVLLIVVVHIAISDEILPELSHALSVFRTWAASDNTGSSARFEDLRLREDIRWVVGGRFFSRKVSTLSWCKKYLCVFGGPAFYFFGDVVYILTASDRIVSIEKAFLSSHKHYIINFIGNSSDKNSTIRGIRSTQSRLSVLSSTWSCLSIIVACLPFPSWYDPPPRTRQATYFWIASWLLGDEPELFGWQTYDVTVIQFFSEQNTYVFG